MATIHKIQESDIAAVAKRLSQRRRELSVQDPSWWQDAEDAIVKHAEYLSFLILDSDAQAFSYGDDVMIAAWSRGQWVIEDAAISDWEASAEALWSAVVAEISGESIRISAAPSEHKRAKFAQSHRLAWSESWWHIPVSPTAPPTTMAATQVGGYVAHIDWSAPIYNHGGPLLLLNDPTAEVLAAAITAAPDLGCGMVAVCQRELAEVTAVTTAGLQHHCDFYEGIAA
ncbi:MAG: hypothetical protein ACRDAX_09730 [Propionibacteriaceae bacterium]